MQSASVGNRVDCSPKLVPPLRLCALAGRGLPGPWGNRLGRSPGSTGLVVTTATFEPLWTISEVNISWYLLTSCDVESVRLMVRFKKSPDPKNKKYRVAELIWINQNTVFLISELPPQWQFKNLLTCLYLSCKAFLF